MRKRQERNKSTGGKGGEEVRGWKGKSGTRKNEGQEREEERVRNRQGKEEMRK